MKMYAHIAFKKKRFFIKVSGRFEDKLYYFYITYSIVFYRSNTNGSVDVKTHNYYGITIDCTCKMFIYLYKTVQKSCILLDLSRKKAKLF